MDTQNYDISIDMTERKLKGAFFTPKLFSDYAHTMISNSFGNDWKEKYTVWDCCCGTCNLTKDYEFANLFCSTLYQEELDLTTNYNKNATKFQFDFLNDDIGMDILFEYDTKID